MGGFVAFEGLHNVRDLGGMPVRGGVVKSGMLFRGDQPFFTTEADRAKLGELGVGTIVDFRSYIEREEKPDPEIPGIRNVHIPIIEDVREGITRDSASNEGIVKMIQRGADIDEAFVDRYMQRTYREFVANPTMVERYARFVDEVIESAEQGKAVLWHCTAGKDRAGFAAVILLETLGADHDEIFADYLRTNEYLSGAVEQIITQIATLLPSDTARDAARRFFRAHESYLEVSYAAANELYGGFESFLEQGLLIDDAKKSHMIDLFVS